MNSIRCSRDLVGLLGADGLANMFDCFSYLFHPLVIPETGFHDTYPDEDAAVQLMWNGEDISKQIMHLMYVTKSMLAVSLTSYGAAG